MVKYSQQNPETYWDTIVNLLDGYYVHVAETVQRLEELYTDTMTVFALRSLMDGQVAEAQRIYENVRVSERDDLMYAWYCADDRYREFIIQSYIDHIPRLSMGLQYDMASRQVQLQPMVNSVIDAAYFGLARFLAVNANALDDFGGKTSIAFCQACGKAFIKNGNRQKYCGTPECQSVRNRIKAKEYYYRKQL